MIRSEITPRRIDGRGVKLPSFFLGLKFDALSDRNTTTFELGRKVTFLEDLTESQVVTMPAIRRSVFEDKHDSQLASTYPNAQKYGTYAPMHDGYSPVAAEPQLPWTPEEALQEKWSPLLPTRVLGPLALNMSILGTNRGYDVTFLDRESGSDSWKEMTRRMQRNGGNAMLATDERLSGNELDVMTEVFDLMMATNAAKEA